MIFGVMLWRGVSIEPQWVVLALLLIALAVGRGKQFIFDWLPFLVLFLAYEMMRGFATKTGFAPHDVGALETWLFDGHLPTVWLQHALYRPAQIMLWDWLAMGIYFMHFALPIAVGFIFWLRDRERYWRFMGALLLMSFLAFVFYLFFPSAPPWHQYPGEVHKIIDETIHKWGVAYYVSPVYTNVNPNQFAAFPSLHAAYPTLAAIYAWGYARWLAVVLAGWAACVWFAIVYLGEHYVVDALFGLCFVAGSVLLVQLISSRLARGVELRRQAARPEEPDEAGTLTG
ncbi:MAG: phosphatase PAP2 family protein [bacterium]|nr:phosphatase PAP2 family protein [bacterium]